MTVIRGQIRGKVARILTVRELVINRGQDDGVHVGMVFAVLDPKAQDIVDPETSAALGSIYRPKIMVRVSLVEQHLAVAGTFESASVNIGGTGYDLGGIAGLFQPPPHYVKRLKTFKTEDAPGWEELAEDEGYVRVGDPVEEVVVVDQSAAPTEPATEGTTEASAE